MIRIPRAARVQNDPLIFTIYSVGASDLLRRNITYMCLT